MSVFKDSETLPEELRQLWSYIAYNGSNLGLLFNRSMNRYNSRYIVAGLIILIIGLISFQLLRLHDMFQPHTYNWRTGMPTLRDQVTTFQEANKHWPKNYGDLVTFMKQINTNFVPESYDRIEFTKKSDGKLEISVYVSESGLTNHIVLTPSNKH